MRRVPLVIATAATLVLTGCGSTGEGSSSDGGTAGDRSGGGSTCLPPCLKKLADRCPLAGACVSSKTPCADCDWTNLCYANGVTSYYDLIAPGTSFQAQVTAADGTFCYSVTGAPGGTITFQEHPPADTATASPAAGAGSSGAWTVTCDGADHRVDTADPECQHVLFPSTAARCSASGICGN